MHSIEQLQPLQDVADRLGVSPRTLSRWSKTGTFPQPIRIGRNTYYPPRTVEDYLNQKLTA